MCTLVYPGVPGYIFLAIPTSSYQRGNAGFPNRHGRKGRAASCCWPEGQFWPIVPCINQTFTLAGLFINSGWKTQWSLQVGDECGKFKTILCFGCGTALTGRKSEELMLNYLDLSHLSRLKNYVGSQSYYLMSFMSTDDRIFVTQENCRYVHLLGFDHHRACLHSPVVHEICSPCHLLKRHIPGISCELQSHQEITSYTSLNQHQSAIHYGCRRKAHSTSVRNNH